MTQLTDPIDPIGRQTAVDYDSNGIDVLAVRQTTGGINEALAQFGSYDSQHRPWTYTDAAQQTYNLQWNSYGQLTQITNPKNEVTRLNYDVNGYGYLQNIQQDWSGGTKTTALTYDGYGRIRTAMDSELYTLTYDYDALDRLTKVTYPDATFEQYDYEKLDIVRAWDRAGHVTMITYDGVGHPLTVRDRLGQLTQYSWCGCGGLDSITDPLGHQTRWVYDVEDRVTQKFYADNPTVPNTQYAYDSRAGHLKSVTDAKNQVKNYSYYRDGTLAGVTYTGAVIPTPGVSFTYNPNYRRLATMTDGTGQTTFTYYPFTTEGTLGAGRLASAGGMGYGYDELGRVVGRNVGIGVGSSQEEMAYDELGRVTTHTTPMGDFIPAYVNATRRLSSLAYPNGQTTWFSYFGNLGDQRLQEILHQNGSDDTISKFDYQYDVLGRIKLWTQQTDANTPQVMSPDYDLEGQLLDATIAPQGGAVSKAFSYQYDGAGNRTLEQIDSTGTSFSSTTAVYDNNVNQLHSRALGPVLFKGKINEPGTVTISANSGSSQPAKMTQDPDSPSNGKIFTTSVSLPGGQNAVQIVATALTGITPPPAGSVATKNYILTVINPGTRTYTYDANGNCTGYTSASGNVSYEWDAEDRLVGINNGPLRSEFTYDGFGRRVQAVEKNNGTVTSTKVFAWSGKELVSERQDSEFMTKYFYPEGMYIYHSQTKTTLPDGTVVISGPVWYESYYYTRDHLGSIREMTDDTGAIRARYDYDPYGRRSANLVTSNPVEADFGYTGHYYHAPSGLHLALYRVYDADTGRWINRDPIQERGGLNLYEYVGNNPLTRFDPNGLIGDGVNPPPKGLPPDQAQPSLGDMANAAGILWNSLNTILGLTLGLAGLPFGGSEPTVDNNAIQFENNPLMFGGDITLGNVICYRKDMGPKRPDPYNRPYTYGDHERAHTYQGQQLGPFYLIAYSIFGIYSWLNGGDFFAQGNYMEAGPSSSPPRSWP